MFDHSKRALAVLGIAVLTVAACGGATAPSPAPATAAPATAAPSTAAPAAASAPPKPGDAVGFTSVVLAQGKLAALPEGTLFVNFLDVPQPAGNTISHAHVAGFVYAVKGLHRLTIGSDAAKDIKPGEAGFVGADLVHSHTNPETSPSQWYFVSIRQTSARAAAPLFPDQKTLYATADLPPTLPQGAYAELLTLVTLQSGGRTAAHKHGGLEVVVVLEGAVQLRTATAPVQTLTAGQGAFVLPNTALQATNNGTGVAKFLGFRVTKDGEVDTTPLDTAP